LLSIAKNANKQFYNFPIFSHNLLQRTASKNSLEICQLTSSLYKPHKYFKSSWSASEIQTVDMSVFQRKSL
jgi:hypothetical protein